MEPSVFDKDEYELTELSETEKPDEQAWFKRQKWAESIERNK